MPNITQLTFKHPDLQLIINLLADRRHNLQIQRPPINESL